MRLMRRHRPSGFTLLEVLIALGIVAIVAILSWQGLQEVLRMRDRLSAVDERLLASMAIFNQMQTDIASIERDTPKGQTLTKDTVSITAEGLYILHTERKPDLGTTQRQTFWTLRGGQLFRISRPVEQPEAETRTEGLPIQGLRLRLWQEGVGWVDESTLGTVNVPNQSTPVYKGRTNPLVAHSGEAPNQPPATPTEVIVRAVEVVLTQTNGQSLVRVLTVGGVY